MATNAGSRAAPAPGHALLTKHGRSTYGSAEVSRDAGHKGESLSQVSLRMWQPLLVVAMYWILQWERSDFTGAFIRTMISCPPPMPRKGKCPRGTFLENGACSARPPGSPDWSGSATCADQFTVVARATAIGGRMSSVTGFCSAIAQALIGSTMVDTMGRRPMMLLALLGLAVNASFFLAACFTSPSVSITLLFAGSIQLALINTFDVATKAMISDLLSNSIIQRGLGYTASNIAANAGVLLAFVCGFFILAMDLTDYTRVWVIFLAVCIAFNVASYCLLHETLNHNRDQADALNEDGMEAQSSRGARSTEVLKKRSWSVFAVASAEMISCFRMVWGDSFLLTVLVLNLLVNMASYGAISITGGYCIFVVGLTQSVGSLSGVFNPAAILCGSAITPEIHRAIGAYASYILGLLVGLGGMTICGLAAVFHVWAQRLFWLGFIILGVGWGISGPSFTAFISIRIPNTAEHGKLFSALSFATSIGTTVGTYIWTNLIFWNNSAIPWIGGLGYFVSAFMYAGITVVYLALFSYSDCGRQAKAVEAQPNPQ